MCAANASAWEGWYGGCGVVVRDSGSGMVAGEGSDGESVPEADWGPGGLEVGGSVDSVVEGPGGEANRPVLWIMEPSLRERMNVDCTPGRDVRWDRRALTWCGIWEVWL